MMYDNRIREIINKSFGSISQTRVKNLDYFRKLSNHKKICLFGAGRAGKSLYNILRSRNIKADMFCDNDRSKWGRVIIDDVKCIPYGELEKYKDDAVCIVSVGPGYSREIHGQLEGDGFRHLYGREVLISQTVSEEAEAYDPGLVRKRIPEIMDLFSDEHSLKVLYYKLKSLTAEISEWKGFSFHDIMEGDAYFIEGGKYLRGSGTIVDCGAYDGDTLMYLVDKIQYVDFEKYIAYEMDSENFSILERRIGKFPEHLRGKITAYNKGVGKKACRMKYRGDSSECFISEDGYKTAEVLPIDEHLYGTKVDYIKMDIEGSEMDALLGAERTIARCRPVCAISIYHKFSDLWEIPLFFRKVMPDSRFMLRHHNNCYYDTVFYAVPAERVK